MDNKKSKNSKPSGIKTNNGLICQNCKEFTNKPGWCKKKEEYTPRKATCRYFERRKK
jgi:hypothetical protein